MSEIRQNMPQPDVFRSVYARNCIVKRIDKPTAADFLNQYHRYGDAACKYRYALFTKRHTGTSEAFVGQGEMVAVAEFSGARKWIKGDKTISSYEWVRYASIDDIRVIGGMSKILKTFIEEHSPDDIMTYAIAELSEGDVYKKLGFIEEGIKNFGSSSSIKFRLKLTDY